MGHKKDNLPFVSVGAWVKLNSHKLLLQLSPYLDVKRYSLISHPQNPHPFIPKGYLLHWWWREWLSRICCRSSTLPSSSSKARFAALQRVVSHWGIASCVTDKDDRGGTDWQNEKCKHGGPHCHCDIVFWHLSLFSLCFCLCWSLVEIHFLESSCHPLIPSCKPLRSAKKLHSSV